MGWRLRSKRLWQGWLWLAGMLLLAGCRGLTSYPADGAPQPMYLARIHFASPAERDQLASELDVWEVHRQEQYLIARLDGGTYLTLAFTGWRISLECARMRQLQSALNLSETTLQQICPLQDRQEGRLRSAWLAVATADNAQHARRHPRQVQQM